MHNGKLKLCRRALIITAVVMMVGLLYAQPAQAANIAVTNVALKYSGANQRFVKFDVSWDASWRASWTDAGGTSTNWDAAWIFVKYRCTAGADTNWHHATLSTNNSDHVAPAGSTINIGLSTNAGGANFGAGVFLYRSAVGNGSWTNTGVKLRWRYADDGVADGDQVDVCVHAIEMVYVPQGSFYAGDGRTTSGMGSFENGQFTNAFLVTNDNYIIYLGGGTNGNLGNNNATAMGNTDDFNDVTGQMLPAEFPKGYNAFYCMKYEISQGQYADFLNQLTNSTQASTRYPNKSDSRHTISGSWPSYSASAPTRSCNYLSWADGAAYADWAGLRPMTELEYEKACRGPLLPVANEYAWGTANIVSDSGDGTLNVSSPENGTETNTTDVSLGAAVYGANQIQVGGVNSGTGPVRCGLFATANSGRISSGSTYWGIMEMSGNLWERLVTVGNSTGRGFTGAHGDGKLNSSGDADVSSWPGINAIGTGLRGGGWDKTSPYCSVSCRYTAVDIVSTRYYTYGARAVRLAPGINP